MPEDVKLYEEENVKPLFFVSSLRDYKGKVLDEQLAKGFYRMHQCMFTCFEVPFENGAPHPVFWLRYLVGGIEFTARQRKVLHRISARFRVLPPKEFIYNEEYEELYQRYRRAMSFDCAEFLEETAGTELMKFDSKVIEIRDGEKLIAAGIFDEGIQSIAGIVNYYDPEYGKYSLGSAMLPLKYLYSQQHGLRYYYPGYISPTYPKFNYKVSLQPEVTEVYLPTIDRWIPYTVFEKYITVAE